MNCIDDNMELLIEVSTMNVGNSNERCRCCTLVDQGVDVAQSEVENIFVNTGVATGNC
jgi:hypothetical protein